MTTERHGHINDVILDAINDGAVNYCKDGKRFYVMVPEKEFRSYLQMLIFGSGKMDTE